MLARVVDKPFVRWPDLLASAVAGPGLLAIVVDDVFRLGLVPLAPQAGGQALVVALLVVAAAVPWISPRKRAERREVRAVAGAVRLGRDVIRERDVTAVRVVRAERGFSIAIARPDAVAFVEVEREEEAARIADALGRKDGPLDIPVASPRLQNVRVGLGVVVLVLAILYACAVSGMTPETKSIPGIAGVALANLVALGGFAVRRDHRRTPWGRHAALHLGQKAFAPQAVVPVSLHARRDEPARVWLARLDAPPAALHAYRSSHAPEQLWDLVRDGEAEVDLRVGAARILRRRYGAESAALVRVVTDEDVRARVALVVDDDDEDAGEKIDRLGPLFRYPPAP